MKASPGRSDQALGVEPSAIAGFSPETLGDLIDRVPSVCHTRRISASALSGTNRKNAASTRQRRTICTPASADYGPRLIRSQEVKRQV